MNAKKLLIILMIVLSVVVMNGVVSAGDIYLGPCTDGGICAAGGYTCSAYSDPTWYSLGSCGGNSDGYMYWAQPYGEGYGCSGNYKYCLHITTQKCPPDKICGYGACCTGEFQKCSEPWPNNKKYGACILSCPPDRQACGNTCCPANQMCMNNQCVNKPCDPQSCSNGGNVCSEFGAPGGKWYNAASCGGDANTWYWATAELGSGDYVGCYQQPYKYCLKLSNPCPSQERTCANGVCCPEGKKCMNGQCVDDCDKEDKIYHVCKGYDVKKKYLDYQVDEDGVGCDAYKDYKLVTACTGDNYCVQIDSCNSDNCVTNTNDVSPLGYKPAFTCVDSCKSTSFTCKSAQYYNCNAPAGSWDYVKELQIEAPYASLNGPTCTMLPYNGGSNCPANLMATFHAYGGGVKGAGCDNKGCWGWQGSWIMKYIDNSDMPAAEMECIFQAGGYAYGGGTYQNEVIDVMAYSGANHIYLGRIEDHAPVTPGTDKTKDTYCETFTSKPFVMKKAKNVVSFGFPNDSVGADFVRMYCRIPEKEDCGDGMLNSYSVGDFNPSEAWSQYGISGGHYDAGSYVGTSVNDAQVWKAVSFKATKYLKIRMKMDGGNTGAQFFYSGDTACPSGFSASCAVSFAVNGDGAYHDYVIDMSSNPNWKGTIKQFRIDPTWDSGRNFAIDYVKTVEECEPPLSNSCPANVQELGCNGLKLKWKENMPLCSALCGCTPVQKEECVYNKCSAECDADHKCWNGTCPADCKCPEEPICGDGLLNLPGEECDPPGSSFGDPNSESTCEPELSFIGCNGVFSQFTEMTGLCLVGCACEELCYEKCDINTPCGAECDAAHDCQQSAWNFTGDCVALPAYPAFEVFGIFERQKAGACDLGDCGCDTETEQRCAEECGVAPGDLCLVDADCDDADPSTEDLCVIDPDEFELEDPCNCIWRRKSIAFVAADLISPKWADCKLEPCTCLHQTRPEGPVCGNGIKEEGEECDDGNEDNFDGCRTDCTLPYCGDNILDDGEQCEPPFSDSCPTDKVKTDRCDGRRRIFEVGDAECTDKCICTSHEESKCVKGECSAQCDAAHKCWDGSCPADCKCPQRPLYCGDGIPWPWTPYYEECDIGSEDLCDDSNPETEDVCVVDPADFELVIGYPYCIWAKKGSDQGSSQEMQAQCIPICPSPEPCKCLHQIWPEQPVCGNGKVEDGEDCEPGQIQQEACGISTGECEPGIRERSCTNTCTWGAWGGCIGGIAPKDEVCNGKDDDCDGLVDEDGVCNVLAMESELASIDVLVRVLNEDCIVPGSNMFALVTVDNSGNVDLKGLRINGSVEEFESRARPRAFDLGEGDVTTKLLVLYVPSGIEDGNYTLRATVSNDDISRLKTREFRVSSSCS